MKKKLLILAVSHLIALAAGFAAGVYVLPILTAEPGVSAQAARAAAQQARYTGQFRRDLPGSDALHWADASLAVTPGALVLEGRVAPGPDYRIYLVPAFVDNREAFLALKARARQVGTLKTFGHSVTPLAPDVELDAYTTVVIWCERFSQFISAARYR
ncbi:DM13 domain-containing protein [Burkholderia alba]|uniref:DM13 domain-containing protein n=1 Tax=Burkholderia alba TaxID=2683677 RepID=UPI002B052D93|nr:DM13 domain-containing protein [Burkholderia alba]